MTSRARPLHERIMERVITLPELEGGCWVWTGSTTPKGYGQIRTNGVLDYVHRIMARHYGMNTEGATVDHLCANANCVRESHIEVCSREENSRRGASNEWREFAAGYVREISKVSVLNPNAGNFNRLTYRLSLAAEATAKYRAGERFTSEELMQLARWWVNLTVCYYCRRECFAPFDLTPNGEALPVCLDCQTAGQDS